MIKTFLYKIQLKLDIYLKMIHAYKLYILSIMRCLNNKKQAVYNFAMLIYIALQKHETYFLL